MKKIALFPGSFDPITKGHEDLILRAIPLFDEIIIAIGVNASKEYFFPLEKRKEFIAQTFATHPSVRVETYEGLTVDYCKKTNANYIIRGLRNTSDFNFESSISQMNQTLAPDVETLFLMTSPENGAISSSIVRDIIRNNGDISSFLPSAVTLK